MRDAPILRSLGKYHLIAALGEGGMANVYLGVVVGPGDFYKLLVLKVLKDELRLGSEHSVDLFWEEARVAAQLAHPNVVHTYEVGMSERHVFLAMEYLEGQTYRALATRAAPDGLALTQALRVLCDTARGLHYAHHLCGLQGDPLGIVHRDVSPQNVFVTYDGQVKLLDFGVAKTRDAGHKTELGLIKGKLDYIAPEQLRGDSVDARADVFSLGVMLWEAVTRERFAGGRAVSDATKAQIRLRGDEAKLRWIRPDVPDALATIVDRALALDPAARWPDAASFADALDGYRESLGEKADAQSLSEIMISLFEEDRRKLRKLIEQQLSAIKEGGQVEQLAELPSLRAPDARAAEHRLQETPSAAPRSLTLAANERDAASSRAAGSTPSEASASWRPRKPSPLRLATMVVVAAGTAGIGLALFPPPARPPAQSPQAAHTRARTESESLAKPSEPALPGAADPAAPEPRSALAPQVQVALEVVPANARVSIDGSPLAPPWSGAFARDVAPHQIEIVADGYRPHRQVLRFDRDHALHVVLQPAARGAGAREQLDARRSGGEAKAAAPEQAAVAGEPKRARERPGRSHGGALEGGSPSAPPLPGSVVSPGSDLVTTRRRVGWAPIDTADPYATAK